MILQEYDIVQIVTLLTKSRSIDGTESVMRQPRVGDEGTIVHILKDAGSDSQYAVESVDQQGMTVWLADFHHSELKLKVRPAQNKRLHRVAKKTCSRCTLLFGR